jgi:hypothetical protein
MKRTTFQFIFNNTGGHAVEIHPDKFAEEYAWSVSAYLSGRLLDFLIDGVSYKDTLQHLPEQGI